MCVVASNAKAKYAFITSFKKKGSLQFKVIWPLFGGVDFQHLAPLFSRILHNTVDTLVVRFFQKAHAQCDVPQTWWKYSCRLPTLACAKVRIKNFPRVSFGTSCCILTMRINCVVRKWFVLLSSIPFRFNNDPSIDILLLTTHVGGLGLNLTGADTVIFVEHDWNPMKDLQVSHTSLKRREVSSVEVVLFYLVSLCFSGYGPSSSYRTEKGCQRIQAYYSWNPRRKDYGVRIRLWIHVANRVTCLQRQVNELASDSLGVKLIFENEVDHIT